MFKKKKINKSTPKSRKRKFYFWKKNKKKKNTKIIIKFISFLVISFLFIWTLILFVIYKKYIEPLPPVENIKNMHIYQTSTIFDKDWKELYEIFKENRIYIDFKDISIHMVNAIVAWEDKRFWTNPWFDIIWIIRATLFWILPWNTIKWTSGLSQQLMKVTYFSNERKLERKIKELYLSWRLNKAFDKEKILELYLNKIFFGSHAYWIEQASRTFFNISASELNILQASILASLPKAPSGLSPHSNKWRLLGFPFIYTSNNKENIINILTKEDIYENSYLVSKLSDKIANLKLVRVRNGIMICNIDRNNLSPWSFRVDNDWCISLWFNDLLKFLNSIEITSWEKVIWYQIWRKDYILWRMFEDKYITFEEYIEAILNSFGYEFEKPKFSIKYPYFVMFIKEYLENKYWEEVISRWWFRIYTTLDSKLQDKAESLVKKYSEINKAKFWAQNAALIAIDNKTWGILSMVWGRDFFDKDGGNNNMITARLQPWSAFKPFVYALAIKNNQIGSKTPIFDLETIFPLGYSPKNFDWKFLGKTDINVSLNSSRNIPAIKMFYLAWWEEKIISFMDKLWVKTLRRFIQEFKERFPNKIYTYSAPLALGTGLMTPLELAWAYSTFANLWIYRKINPILKITDRRWNIIESKERNKIKEEVMISPAVSYIINSILSDTTTRPPFWNTLLSLPERDMAAKTWTSTKQYYKNGEKIIAPRNLWVAAYTPQITTVVWAWNTDWKELYLSGNWLEWTGPIMNSFMKYAHKWKPIKNWLKPFWVKTANISTISWLLAPDDFPTDFVISSDFVNLPTKYDNSLKKVKVDSLCNWKITEATPAWSIKKWYFINFSSLKPHKPNWELPIKKWIESWKWKENYWFYWNIFTKYPTEVCKREWKWEFIIRTSISDTLTIWRNDIQVWFSGDRRIKAMNIYIWNFRVKTLEINPNIRKKWFNTPIFINVRLLWVKTNLKIEIIDREGFVYEKNIEVSITNRPEDIFIENISN